MRKYDTVQERMQQVKQEQIKTLIEDNTGVFESAFLMTEPSDEDIKKAEQELGFEIPESYIWFLKQYGHGGFFFEFLGYGRNGNALFVRETLKERKNGLPANLLVIENCDEYVVCINTDNGNIVSWSHYDNDGTIRKQVSFEDYFIDCLNNAIDNYDDE